MNESSYALVKTNERFERGWNRLQRTIEIMTTAVVIAGLAGLFGTGPLSSAVASLPATISISYERILRRTKQSDMTITLIRPASRSQIEIELPTRFLDEMDIVSTSPRSAATRAEADGVTYVFDLGAARRGQITFALKAKGLGAFTSSVRADGMQVDLHQFIWP